MRVETVLLLLSFVACARYPALLPAPGAHLAPEGGAEARAEGIEIRIDGTAWDGIPRDLSTVITPVWVELHNESERPMQVRYEAFSLLGDSGFHYAVLPPFHPDAAPAYGAAPAKAEGKAKTRRMRTHRQFFVAPYYGPFFDYQPWPYPFLYEPGYYDRYYAMWASPLPSPDMLAEALPEGVLDQGGQIGGFLYFQRAPDSEQSVRFQARLIDARSEDVFGEVLIPMVPGRS